MENDEILKSYFDEKLEEYCKNEANKIFMWSEDIKFLLRVHNKQTLTELYNLTEYVHLYPISDRIIRRFSYESFNSCTSSIHIDNVISIVARRQNLSSETYLNNIIKEELMKGYKFSLANEHKFSEYEINLVEEY